MRIEREERALCPLSVYTVSKTSFFRKGKALKTKTKRLWHNMYPMGYKD